MISFVLAMTLHPEVQKRAHEEIDKIVGLGRLPTFADRPSLPYVECILKESLRWYPANPIGGYKAVRGPFSIKIYLVFCRRAATPDSRRLL